MKKLKVIVIGAGNRGRRYAELMQQTGKYEIIAVAEAVKERREYIRDNFNVPQEMCFETWEPLLEKEKLADVAVIATMDRLHYAPVMAAIEKGYDILLEKPVTPTPQECCDIELAAKKKGVKILVCHVLRYTPFYGGLKKLINDGAIGDVVTIHADECVGNVHQSHSFVRGNWGNESRASFMLLQKCCHDIDILQWLMGKECKRVHSFGSLTHFTEKNAPAGSTKFCLDGCPHIDTCIYSVEKVYLSEDSVDWMRDCVTGDWNATTEERREALRTNNYGRCAYRCDNDVVDHQVVNMEFEDGATISFNMNAFNKGGRHIRIMGTKGELSGSAADTEITYFNFETGETTTINPAGRAMGDTIDTGHGGGDSGIINVLYEYLTTGYEGDLLSEIGVSAKNHMIVFAAEHSRRTNTIVDVDSFKEEVLNKIN